MVPLKSTTASRHDRQAAWGVGGRTEPPQVRHQVEHDDTRHKLVGTGGITPTRATANSMHAMWGRTILIVVKMHEAAHSPRPYPSNYQICGCSTRPSATLQDRCKVCVASSRYGGLWNASSWAVLCVVMPSAAVQIPRPHQECAQLDTEQTHVHEKAHCPTHGASAYQPRQTDQRARASHAARKTW
jgi:hypothetical protein